MKTASMLFFFSILFFIPLRVVEAQSKKEKIEVLNGRLDSLNQILEKEREVSKQKNQIFENEIQNLKDEFSKIQIGLSYATKKLNILKMENDSMVSLNDSLQGIMGLGTSKLDNEIFWWLREQFFHEGQWRFCNMNYDDGEGREYNDLEELKMILNELQIEQKDINKDGILDAIVYISVPWCSFTTALQRPFGSLIYSREKDYLRIDNERLSSIIYDLLLYDLKTNKRMDFDRFGVWGFNSFSGSDGNLNGSALIWLNDDPYCCASYSADIIYNPFTGAWSYAVKSNKMP